MQRSENGLGLEGESKELTVLFTDIRNFTKISEPMTASEVKQFLALFLNPMTEIIFNHKGTIDKYVGDMIMAFWGAPLPDFAHALNAVSSAWDMKVKLADLNVRLKSLLLPEINVGIGINTGTMSVGDMGSEFRRAYTVLGDSVNLASRLESLTKFYQVGIIVGEKTQEETKNDFIYRKLDRVKVKGKANAHDIYELVSPLVQAPADILENIKLHEKALNAYFNQEWDASDKLFKQLLAQDPSHAALCKLFLERIASLSQTPKKTIWDGVYTFETK
jgi:adenylate cyclase